MGKRQVTILLVILAVVAGISVAVNKLRSTGLEASSIKGAGEKVLPDFPINQVATVSLKTGKDSLTLNRKEEDGAWLVAERDDYPADFGKLGVLLREMWKLKIAQTVEAGPSQFGRLELLEPGDEGKPNTGTLMEFKDGEGNSVASLLIGKQYERQSDTPSPMGGGFSSIPAGRYLRPSNGNEVWLVSETLAASVETDPAQWIQKDFFKVENLRAIEKKSGSKDDDWKIERKTEDGDWKLLFLRSGEALDDARIASLKSAFSTPRFDDVVAGTKSVGEGATEFVLDTFDGFTYKVTVGKELDDRKYHLTVSVSAQLPAERKAEDGEPEEDKKKKDEEFQARQEELKEKLEKEEKLGDRVFLVPNYVVSPLLKARSEITKVDAPEPAGEAGETGEAKIPGGVPLIPAPDVPKGGAGASTGGTGQIMPAPNSGTPRATAVTEPIEIDLSRKPGPEDGKKAEPKDGTKPAPKTEKEAPAKREEKPPSPEEEKKKGGE